MNNNDIYIYVITALLPLSACMVVLQVNPYHALVIRGVLGAIAAMVYAVLGAADVALTEALMGTMLAITLYAIAVRSSLVVRLGVKVDGECHFETLCDHLRTIFGKHYLRLEIVTYTTMQALQQALIAKEVHATCIAAENDNAVHEVAIRVKRLYEIVQAELTLPETTLTYVDISNSNVKNVKNVTAPVGEKPA